MFLLLLIGTADFIGLNFYTSNVVTHKANPTYDLNYYDDTDLTFTKDPSWLGYAFIVVLDAYDRYIIKLVHLHI